MRIGVDIDGVITDIEQWQIDFGSKYVYEKHGDLNINNSAYDTKDVYGIEQDIDDRLWAEGIFDYIKQPARRFASEVMKALKDDGNEIYIITARTGEIKYAENMNQEIMEDIVRKWLKEYDIPYDKLIFTKDDKVEICKTENVSIMIEDFPKNINKISKVIPVICFDANYNRECVSENITRCYSWYDILNKLRKS